MDNLFNINQVAFMLKVHPLTIRRYIKEGRIKAIKVGGNIRIKESQLQDFHKEFVPGTDSRKNIKSKNPDKIFTIEDPIFQLKGRVASLGL